ncbi:MAG: SDR family NAD(P)-dependent oxidoreductase [Alphaproteobacteria bacterium]
MQDLEGKVAFVTGASSGLGRHFALTLSGAGASVALAARRVERLKAVAREIEAAGGRALAVPLDVTDAAAVHRAVEAAAAGLGPLSVLVNNAGVAVTKPALEHEEEDWDRVVDTNLKGAWLVAREVARHMVQWGQGGTIINIASILGCRLAAHLSAYSASKAGLLHLTRALALELARYDIRVNALAPGYIETDMNREFFASEAGQRLVRRMPQQRLGDPKDLDGAFLLLASDASRYMTGSVITIDGGLSLA